MKLLWDLVPRRIEMTGGELGISLKPNGRLIKHRAGQFAFVQFVQPGISEIHPFTISKASDSEGTLRFTVKDLGDFTGRLDHEVMLETPVRVSGPFGHFRMQHGNDPQTWIASGVGITPFMAWAESLQEADSPVHLFYSARTRAAAPHLEDLEQLARNTSNLHLHFIETQHQERLTARRILDARGTIPSNTHVSFCGPEEMRQSLRRLFRAIGLPARHFHFEAFEIRSGIGLRRLADWLWRTRHNLN